MQNEAAKDVLRLCMCQSAMRIEKPKKINLQFMPLPVITDATKEHFYCTIN